MTIAIDTKYLRLISSKLRNFKQKNSPIAIERPSKTFFCEVLGEKYCACCIECHERRFAKIYEKKYIKLKLSTNDAYSDVDTVEWS